MKNKKDNKMKKIILLLIMILSLGISACCEWEEEEERNPLQDVEIGTMNDYYFENDIEINTLGNAMIWLWDNLEYIPDETGNDYWQLPEQTYEWRTGDCEDYCIMFMYLLKTKLNIDTNLIMIKKGDNTHTLVYPIPYGPDNEPMYYEVKNNFLSSTIQEGWYEIYSIPYNEVMWMTYNYHDNVGIYY